MATGLRRLHLYKEDLIAPEHGRQALALCREVDESDTPPVALSLERDSLLWMGDKRLRDGLSERGFSRFYVPSP